MKATKLATKAALGIMGLMSSQAAYAAAQMSFQLDGGSVVTCSDNTGVGVNCTNGTTINGGTDFQDTNTLAGGMVLSFSNATFLVNVSTGITKPIFSASTAHMDLNSINVQIASGTHDLIIKFTDTGWTPLGGINLGFGGTLSNPAGSTITAQGYYDTTNTAFGLGTQIGSNLSSGPGAFGLTTSGAGSPTSPYSLTQVLTLHTTGAGNFSGDFELTQVPEPTTISLLGGVLLATAGILRRRMKKA